MKAIAVIAEFNPFHRGHRQLIETLRERHGAVPIVIIMSGSFVQRGEPAMFDKWRRAQWAVSCGADLVVELPCAFALSGAEGFASGGVRLAKNLGCTHIACGVEQGTAADLMELATAATGLDVCGYLAKARTNGLTYGAALTQALIDAVPDKADLLMHSNALLALEYAKAIVAYAPELELDTVIRESSHDGDGCNSSFLRQAICTQLPGTHYEAFIPDLILADMQEAIREGNYVDYDRYHDMALYQSRLLPVEKLGELAAFSEGIENRWHETMGTAATWYEGLDSLKTRRYPFSRLCRMAAYVVLGISKAAMGQWHDEGPTYVRMLAMDQAGGDFLHVAREKSVCSFITKITKADRELSPSACAMLSLDLLATDIQYLCMKEAGQRLSRQDFYRSPVIASFG